MYRIRSFDVGVIKKKTFLTNLFPFLGIPFYKHENWKYFWDTINDSTEKPSNLILYNFSHARLNANKDAEFIDNLIKSYNEINGPTSIIQFDYTEKLVIGQFDTIFHLRPFQYGLRGDDGLWNELEAYFANKDFPKDEEELISKINSAIVGLTNNSLAGKKNFYVEKYDEGGMSGGIVSVEFWDRQAIPLLIGRYRKIKIDKR